jgi:hypothetical protein
MTNFVDAWNNADPDAAGSGEAPPEGIYDVALTSADAFLSKSAGEPWIKLTFKVMSAQHQGHEWDVLQGFKSQKQANFTKRTVRQLGVDVDTAVGGLDELGDLLQSAVGKYFVVEVKRTGDYLNTYLQDGSAQAPVQTDFPVDAPTAPASVTDDEPVPF